MTSALKSTFIASLVVTYTLSGSAQALDWLETVKGAIGTATKSEDEGSTINRMAGLSSQEIIAGLKEALRVGTTNVTGQLGAANGFNGDSQFHIPLPQELQAVQSTLKRVGLSAVADDVELKLNRGAEAAMPKVKSLVWNAISMMSLDDAKAIYDGPADAATTYFRRVSAQDLKVAVKPVIDQALQNAGAIAAYDSLLGQYQAIPFVPDLKANLSEHATALALDGVFHYLAKEEAAIRANPAKRTSEILIKVFGGK